MSVDEEIETAVDALEGQKNRLLRGIFGKQEGTSIEPARILFRNARRIDRDRIVDVGIVRNVKSPPDGDLPVHRDGQFLAFRRVERSQLRRRAIECKIPIPGKRKEDPALGAGIGFRRLVAMVGDKIGVRLLAPQMKRV